MFTRIKIKHFKLFKEIDLDLGQHVVLVGPNNSGKTSLLQAIALWEIGLKKWSANRDHGTPATKRSKSVTINRNDLVSLPVPSSYQLWHQLRTRSVKKVEEKIEAKNWPIEISVFGVNWSYGLGFRYANRESIYCRPLHTEARETLINPDQVKNVKIAYLPPMSGLMANELRLDPGAIDVRLGEGRTAEVLRNLCYQLVKDDSWVRYCDQIEFLFGVQLNKPMYIGERGEITMSYKNSEGVLLDLSASGRGQQQTMLLLAHMMVNPGSVLLLDEPDAHLEILRQRQIYSLLRENAEQTGSQIIAASHSEVVLNEAAGQDTLIAFVGKPHNLDRKHTSQIRKALSTIGFEDYLSAEKTGWVLYLEGPTDLLILRELAKILNHRAKDHLEKPFVKYVGNQPTKAKDHFYGLLEAKSNLYGIAIYDRLETELDSSTDLIQTMWKMRELENYICKRDALLKLAKTQGVEFEGPLFAEKWLEVMNKSIEELEQASKIYNKPSPWGTDVKSSDEFLKPLFNNFYKKLNLPVHFFKKNYHQLVQFLDKDEIDKEVIEKLDAIVDVANRADQG